MAALAKPINCGRFANFQKKTLKNVVFFWEFFWPFSTPGKIVASQMWPDLRIFGRFSKKYFWSRFEHLSGVVDLELDHGWNWNGSAVRNRGHKRGKGIDVLCEVIFKIVAWETSDYQGNKINRLISICRMTQWSKSTFVNIRMPRARGKCKGS